MDKILVFLVCWVQYHIQIEDLCFCLVRYHEIINKNIRQLKEAYENHRCSISVAGWLAGWLLYRDTPIYGHPYNGVHLFAIEF